LGQKELAGFKKSDPQSRSQFAIRIMICLYGNLAISQKSAIVTAKH